MGYPWYCRRPFRWIYYREEVRVEVYSFTGHFVFGFCIWIDPKTKQHL
jgi:hypothetical protein